MDSENNDNIQENEKMSKYVQMVHQIPLSLRYAIFYLVVFIFSVILTCLLCLGGFLGAYYYYNYKFVPNIEKALIEDHRTDVKNLATISSLLCLRTDVEDSVERLENLVDELQAFNKQSTLDKFFGASEYEKKYNREMVRLGSIIKKVTATINQIDVEGDDLETMELKISLLDILSSINYYRSTNFYDLPNLVAQQDEIGKQIIAKLNRMMYACKNWGINKGLKFFFNLSNEDKVTILVLYSGSVYENFAKPLDLRDEFRSMLFSSTKDLFADGKLEEIMLESPSFKAARTGFNGCLTTSELEKIDYTEFLN